tara:strand:+ start:11415 stop:13460 length:2046 start_codon:yes stop_codon:yes gene_type:complete
VATQIQKRRGTDLEHESFTGAVGEITVVTDNSTIRVHDGIKAGGHELGVNDIGKAHDFATVADMAASTEVFPVGKRLHVNNRVSFQFGGGGDFIVYPIPTVSNTYGSIALQDSKVAVLQDKVEGRSDVKQYGALGNDAADDTGAVNAAHAENDNVYFPKTSGAYRISTVGMTDRAKFESNGATVKGITTGSLFSITDPVGGSAENIEISGFLLESTVPSSGVAINIGTNIRRVYIHHNRIKLFNKGIQIEGAYSSDISYNEIRNNTIGIEALDGCHAMTLINNLCNQNLTRGLSITGTMRDVTVIGGAYQASQIGIFATGVESFTILGDVYYEINSIADVKLVNCYTPKIFSGNSSSSGVSEASIILDGCAGNCRVAGMTYSAGTNSTPAHILIKGVNGVTVLEDNTYASGHTNPVDTSGATNAKNVSIGSGSTYALNASNKGIKYQITIGSADEWTQEFTNVGTASGRATLQHTSTTGRDYRISTDGVMRWQRYSTGAEIFSVNMANAIPTFQFGGHLNPFVASTGIPNLGSASREWNTLFATTAPVISSDRKLKANIRSLSDTEKLVGAELRVNIKMYQLVASVKTKGEEARLHCGVIAQEVRDIFANHDLDSFKYGILCYDEWEDEYEDIIEIDETTKEPKLDKEGNCVISGTKLILPSGNQYSIRYEELIMFILGSL